MVCCITGLVWILQGTDVITSSRVMSGHGRYTAYGIVLVVVGLALIAWAARIRQARLGARAAAASAAVSVTSAESEPSESA